MPSSSLPIFFSSLIIRGSFTAAFVPIFSQKLVGNGKENAIKFAAQAISVLALFVGVFVLIMEILMPVVVMFLAPGFSDDAEKVTSYILMDIILPTLADGITDVLKKSIDAIFGRESRSSSNSRSSKISYRSYYESPDNRGNSAKTRGVYNYDDIIFNSRGEADEVLDRMDELVQGYGNVSVAEFYDLAGVSSEYTSNKYGWTDIHTAKVVRVSGDGYMIKLPRAMPL